MRAAPSSRVRATNDARPAERGRYVLYWSIANRRTRFNFALQHAIARAEQHGVPLVVLEGLRCDHAYASPRIHHFVMQGMADQSGAYAKAGVRYLPFVERSAGEGRRLLSELAGRAVRVVADDSPAFGLAHWLRAAAGRLPVACEAVDANGLLPLGSTDRVFTTAASFRRHLQKVLPEHLAAFPEPDPLAELRPSGKAVLPASTRTFRMASTAELADPAPLLARLPIDADVGPIAERGGSESARRRMRAFIAAQLDAYGVRDTDPTHPGTSGLSAYLHFGQLSAHEVFMAVAEHEGWEPDALGPATGSRNGWWDMGDGAEAFLDELITWRELGFNMAWQREDASSYETLPQWAIETLARHEADPRPWIYEREQLENAATHDPVWNAAQRQLMREGRIHGYLRMLWGKKILEWSRTPREALATAFELNDRWAIDGRDPNSISGICWTLGRYDRAWGPERPIFGKVRYMSSENTARKMKLGPYLERYGESDRTPCEPSA